MALTMKRGDTRTAIKAALISPKGTPVKLNNASVKFKMATYRKGSILVNREADILSADDGIVSFVFEPEEVTTLGTMKAEFEVTYEDGSVETFPNQGYILINFESDLA
ncbi:BppU family phage baseplate upper protein [Paenibacillus sp. GCM10023248]|uniref:BppU family phage baseplate upper protein n=1 Tax=unclassified Paenibacillus TaxID=185978 RepID=UPI0023790481|nr:BppU family phage baseplate upper protein [Paenibacillus sp. MAHUQ-63]MDD9266040.1 BppU family phage baseplate upper protein [Paenibacillus sp. MAHUQ-63]